MNIEVLHSRDGQTITARPLVKRLRFPPIREVIIEDRQATAILYDADSTELQICSVPIGFEVHSFDKYEIIFKTNTPVIKPPRFRNSLKTSK